MSALAVRAQDKPKDDVVAMVETTKYHLQALKAESERESLWVENVVQQFINSNPGVKAHQDLAKQKEKEYNDLVAQAWKDAKLDQKDYDMDIEAGKFHKKPPATASVKPPVKPGN